MDKENIEIIDKLASIIDQLLDGDVKTQYKDEEFNVSGNQELNRLMGKILQLRKRYMESFHYIMSLSSGNLDVETPRHNTFVAPYKQLQSELRHLNWQINMVTEGDYNQQVSFLGDLSVAFNKMINALRARQELELQERTEELKSINRLKDRLFSIVAHDLKNPFNALVGYSSLLVDAIQNRRMEEFEEMASIMHESAIQGNDLLMNLLEWSRQQSGRIQVTPQILYLESLIRYSMETVRLAALSKKITLESSDVNGYQVYTDNAILNTVLRNLISNAIKYTPEGGKISVNVEKKTDHYLISVVDTGIGIAEDDMQKLFCVDTVHSTKGTNNESGTGLGLILCHEFVRMLQGKIWVESKPGCGSTFAFTLPDMWRN